MAQAHAARLLGGVAVAALVALLAAASPAQAGSDVVVHHSCRIDIARSGAVLLKSEVRHRTDATADRSDALPALADATRTLDADLRSGALEARFGDTVTLHPLIAADEIGYTAQIGPIAAEDLGVLRQGGVAQLPCGELISQLSVMSAGPFGVRAEATALGAGSALDEAQRAGLRVERDLRIAVPGQVISAPGAALRSSTVEARGSMAGLCTGLTPVQDARWAQPAPGDRVHLVGSGWAPPWWLPPSLAGVILVTVAAFATALVRGLRRE